MTGDERPPFRPASEARDLPRGVRADDVLRFNAPLPAIATGAAVVGIGAALAPVWRPVRRLAALGSAAAIYFLVASRIATQEVFDRSGLTHYRWLRDELGLGPVRWVNLTTGFDDTTGTLASLWPESEFLAVDRFDAGAPHEAALLRARAIRPPSGVAVPPDAPLPIADRSVDAVFLLMAAHEVRRPDARHALFADAARILAEGGRLVVVEHARDLANALAFGPGVLHFYPAATWRDAGAAAGLRLVTESRHTPFVRSFVFGRS